MMNRPDLSRLDIAHLKVKYQKKLDAIVNKQRAFNPHYQKDHISLFDRLMIFTDLVTHKDEDDNDDESFEKVPDFITYEHIYSEFEQRTNRKERKRYEHDAFQILHEGVPISKRMKETIIQEKYIFSEKEKTYKCLSCSFSDIEEKKMKSHLEKAHDFIIYWCIKCCKGYKYPHNYTRHLSERHEMIKE